MKIVVIGAVAAGTSAAAKARRNDELAEIVIYEKDRDISYSGCGLPYFIGGEIEDIHELTPRDASFFQKKYDITIKTSQEVLAILSEQKTLLVKNIETGEQFTDTYDKLILATGAAPFVPKIEGIEAKHVFFLRTVEHARRMKRFIDEQKPKTAVIVGSGFIGLEVLENLIGRNMDVTIVELANQITPNLDEDMALFLENLLCQRNVKIQKAKSVQKIEETYVVLNDGEKVNAQLVLMATGVRPNTALATSIGIKLGKTGAIMVDDAMCTNIQDISACGDCIETFSEITGKGVYRPLGSTANKTGRIAGDAITGGSLRYQGNLSTGIFKLFDLTIASTGLSEREARQEGYDIEIAHLIKPDKPSYFQGEEMAIKAIADRKTKRLLGVQIIGKHGVDKRIDVFVTLLSYKATVDELFHLDLAYAPPFSTTKDPVHYTGMVLENAISRGRKLLTATEVRARKDDLQIIDARSRGDFTSGCVDCAVNIPQEQLRNTISDLDPNKPTVTYCNKGVTGNAAQNILIGRGFKEVYNLSGGHNFYKRSQVNKKSGEA